MRVLCDRRYEPPFVGLLVHLARLQRLLVLFRIAAILRVHLSFKRDPSDPSRFSVRTFTLPPPRYTNSS